jgi:hypothetical protein
MGMNWLA